ncbi:hypothetical protein AB835_11435 [Candidatus Endobugula sertula]|uniref:Haemolysin activator HlyB C-terminal domain-containing protein n=1 Tax=Candidatus Endobugula sertula TaxID=62101 RepID=A0A1D2QN00_9GAMM|nr:hypothetical protein AB835_11435 [Candidatus Endobugula sertula]
MVVFLTYRAAPRVRFGSNRISLELSPHAVISYSNLINYQGVGASIRVGSYLSQDYGSKIFSPLSSSNNTITHYEGFSWHVFLGAERRHVDRNYLLEGTTSISNIQTVTKEDYVTDAHVGFVLSHPSFSIGLTLTERSKEFLTQKDKQKFIRFGISFLL